MLLYSAYVCQCHVMCECEEEEGCGDSLKGEFSIDSEEKQMDIFTIQIPNPQEKSDYCMRGI